MQVKKVSQRGKKVLLINISLRPDSNVMFFPIGIGYIATALKNANIQFDLYDIEVNRYSNDEVKHFFNAEQYDYYLLGAIVTGYSKIKRFAKMIRDINENAIIICGNSVASSIPDIIFFIKKIRK